MGSKTLTYLIAMLFLIPAIGTQAQSSPALAATDPLSVTLIARDSLLFDAAMHTCDFKQIENVLAPEFEFFQDKGMSEPATLQSRSQFVGNLKWACNKKAKAPGLVMRRELDKTTVQTFRSNDNEAVQMGVQRFYAGMGEYKPELVETSKFVRTWKKTKGVWQISREMDYLVESNPHKAVEKSDSLYNQIVRMDSILFDAFNTRKMDLMRELFTTDMEFYHDRGGLTLYDDNMNAFEQTFSSDRKVRRELVKGSIEVYPVPGFGAIQVAQHKFYNTEPGETEQLGGTFKFVHVWKYQDGVWKLARVVSFDH